MLVIMRIRSTINCAYDEPGLQRTFVYNEPNSWAKFEIHLADTDVKAVTTKLGYNKTWIRRTFFVNPQGVRCERGPLFGFSQFHLGTKENLNE